MSTSHESPCICGLLLKNISHWLVRNFSSDVLAYAGFLHNVATVLQDMTKERHSIKMIVGGHIYGCARMAVSVISHVTSSSVKNRTFETVLLLAISLCVALTWL